MGRKGQKVKRSTIKKRLATRERNKFLKQVEEQNTVLGIDAGVPNDVEAYLKDRVRSQDHKIESLDHQLRESQRRVHSLKMTVKELSRLLTDGE